MDYWYTLADRDYFRPLDEATAVGELFMPSTCPARWESAAQGIWQAWSAPEARLADQGWKIHVSTRRPRLQHTLDVVARACFDRHIPFKHLRASLFYDHMHHKHASRAQSGKFCTAYPQDEQIARALLDRLADELAGEVGPYILSDRRYGRSGVVFYRFGSFVERSRLTFRGDREPMIQDGLGHTVVDERIAAFVLPAGIKDPFSTSIDDTSGNVVLDGRFEVTSAIRHSAGGGAYCATELATGRVVFVKEARAHCGLLEDGTDAQDRLENEWRMLRHLHSEQEGLAPEPIARFSQWEHEYLVSEFIAGLPFVKWVAAQTVMGRLAATADQRRRYLDRAQRVVLSVRNQIDRLHDAGVRFGDLSHNNVLVQADDSVRLVDFEGANLLSEPPTRYGTTGYKPNDELVEAGIDDDAYGLAGLAQFALFPLHVPLERDPGGRLALWRRDLCSSAEPTPPLWDLATAFVNDAQELSEPAANRLPSAEECESSPVESLNRLAQGLIDDLLSSAQPTNPDWVFPPPVFGFVTNTSCVEHGTAGVLHALHWSGTPIPESIVRRFRRDAFSQKAILPPGLQVGTAGIGWVLSELGLVEEAAVLLDQGRTHPLTSESPSLAYGSAGVGMAHLALFNATGSARYLDVATQFGDRLAELARDIPAHTPGLQTGLSGIALFLHDLALSTGIEGYLAAAITLLHRELDRAIPGDDDVLIFKDLGGLRNLPYLSIGSAGVAVVATRLAAATGDERCLRALGPILRYALSTCSVEPGLSTGVAGLAFAAAEHADFAADRGSAQAALRIATGLTKYAVHRPNGLAVLGSFGSRFHADLGAGTAGVLHAVNRVLHGPQVHMFTTSVRSERLATGLIFSN